MTTLAEIRQLLPKKRRRNKPTAEQELLARDLKILARFVQVFCDGHHAGEDCEPLRLKTHDVQAVAGRPVALCAECRRLLAHALVKRTRCPLDPKPACKQCPEHCYAPSYRTRMQEVMRYSGRKLVMSGRLDYLWHLFF